jgi:hypothetical protein
MLENFLKGNGFSFELATLPWPWETAKYLGDNKGWNAPVMGEPSGGAMTQTQVGKFPIPAGLVILPQGQRTHLRPLTDLFEAQRSPREGGANADQRQRNPCRRRRTVSGAEDAKSVVAGTEHQLAWSMLAAPTAIGFSKGF